MSNSTELTNKDLIARKWKTERCPAEDCWCLIIVPEGLPPDDDMTCIAPAGTLHAEIAEHIVSLHNASIINQGLIK